MAAAVTDARPNVIAVDHNCSEYRRIIDLAPEDHVAGLDSLKQAIGEVAYRSIGNKMPDTPQSTYRKCVLPRLTSSHSF